MKLYNTLTKSKDEFTTHEPGKVNMYTCGPTVYHFAHIGNLRTYIMEDVLEKFLRYDNYDVKRVMNITDVGHLSSDADTGEDKMLAGAKREKKSVLEIAKYYTDAFFSDCEKLNIKKPDIVAPATNYIEEYIHLIETLIEKGYGYIAGGNVYFDTAKLDAYYIFGNFSEDDLAVGVRDSVEVDENKRSKSDFVLWFTKSKFDDQELKWDSPWGNGYPGWHIECSAISMKYLGEYLDIHCGGIDNAFPHHTNEVAQSEAYTGHRWCNNWFHVLHLNDARGKMSKSKGDFLTVSLLEEKGYNPLVYRMFCLQSHYRKPLAFTFDSLDNVATAYNKLIGRISAIDDSGEVDMAVAEEAKKSFTEVVGNDLNTSLGLTAVYDVFKMDTNGATKLHIIADYDEVLSLDLIEGAQALKKDSSHGLEDDMAAEIEALIAQRTQARKDKDWATADKIRDELNAKNVVVEDTPQGIKWSIKK